jgi:hypothetical protein
LESSSRSGKIKGSFKRLWTAAFSLAEHNLQWGTHQQKAWAHASMVELALLSTLWRVPQKCREVALRHANKALEIKAMALYPDAHFDGYSIWRQLWRYGEWGWGPQHLQDLSSELAKLLDYRK